MSLSVSELSYAYPSGADLFYDVSFSLGKGEHWALVGANGVGKSTLMQIVAREREQLDGSIHIDGTFLYMPQDVGFGKEQTIKELLLSFAPQDLREPGKRLIAAERKLAQGDPDGGMEIAVAISDWSERGGYELEAQWDSALDKILCGSLALDGDRSAATLSGGEAKQLALTMLFNSDADVLLLDEPDNFLDIPAKVQLEKDIQSSRKTILLISHDRALLAAASDKLVTVESSGAWVHGGSYATYAQAKADRQKRLGDAVKQWKEEERRLYEHYLFRREQAKVSPKLAAASQAAKSRWEKFKEAGAPPEPVRDQDISVTFRGVETSKTVLRAKALGLNGLIAPFDLEIFKGERVVIIGSNGTGKSHALRLLSNVQPNPSGSVELGNGVSIGSFSQLNNRPDFMGSTLEDIVSRETGAYEKTMRVLARYGLQPHARQLFDSLSGGQKARLEILNLELQGHNFLLLDEPTDNLDIESSEALEIALASFDGTCVSVSHDREFLKKQDRFLLLDTNGSFYEILDYPDALQSITSGQRVRNAKLLSVGGPSPKDKSGLSLG
jgi:ATPase subunit of ABC transporter with duplicated ATPase domains